MLIGYLVCKMGWLHLYKITIGTTFMKLSASWWKCSRCKLRLEIRDRFGSCEWKKKIFRDNGAKSEKMWMSRRSEMVGWREELLLLLRVEWRETASEMEAGGKDHLCGDWSPGPTAQCWLSFNPPLLPPQRHRDSRRETGKPTKQPLGFIIRRGCAIKKPENPLKPAKSTVNVCFCFSKKRLGR